MNPRQVYYIARREYIARVRNKAFIFTTLLVPILLGIYLVVLPEFFSRTGTEELRIAILDTGTGLSDSLIARLDSIKEPRIRTVAKARIADPSKRARSDYTRAVREGELDGYILLIPDEEIIARAQYFARETGNFFILSRVQASFQSVSLEKMLYDSGVDFKKVQQLQRSGLETVTISSEGEKTGGFEVVFFSTLAFGMLLYLAVLINGQGMALAIVEEKSSRLIEVILGAVTALEFMAGKIIGVLFSGMTQLAIWVSCAIMAALYALPALALGFDQIGFDLARVLNLRTIFYFSIFFTLGYLLYTTLFAAVAATCSSTEELGQAMFPAMFPFVLAFFATFYAVPNPSTSLTRVLSLLPPFTPLVMLARVNVLMPPLWEVWLGIVLLAGGVLAAALFAGKIFQFALLMHGKRPSIAEVIRLIRNS